MSAPGSVRRASNGKDDWGTPWPVYNKLNEEFSFHLDVCASEENHKAPRWLEGPCNADLYRAEGYALDVIPELGPRRNCACGLCSDWMDYSCFVNCPYSQASIWVSAAYEKAKLGATVVHLLPNNTEVDWFQNVVCDTADEVRFVRRRIQFIHSDDCECKACLEGRKGSNTGGSLIVVWRPFPQFRSNGPKFSTWDWM